MPISLTQWWEKFEKDINKLSSVTLNGVNFSEYDLIVNSHNMIRAGSQIEQLNTFKIALEGRSLENTIKENTLPIRDRFTRQEPAFTHITNVRDLLFALIYRDHLARFSDVTSTKSIIQNGVPPFPGIKDNKSWVANNAENFTRTINRFISEHKEAIYAAIPETRGKNEEQLIPTLMQAIRGADITEAAANALSNHFDSLTSEHDIFIATSQMHDYCDKLSTRLQHFSKFNSLLNKLDEAETFISFCTNNKEALFEALDHSTLTDIEKETWRLKIEPPQTEYTGVRWVAAAAYSKASSAASSVTSSAWYWLTPNIIKSPAEYLASAISHPVNLRVHHHFYHSTENLNTLRAMLQQQISVTQDQIQNSTPDITTQQLSEASTDDLGRISDNCKLLGDICKIYTDLNAFIAEQRSNHWIRFLDWFKPLNYFFSKNNLHGILSDRIILLQEARSLKRAVEDIKQDVLDGKDNNAEQQLNNCLRKTYGHLERINPNSLFSFHQQETEAAKASLEGIITASAA